MNGFVTDHHDAGGQDQLDFTQVEAETIMQPNRMLDCRAAVGVRRPLWQDQSPNLFALQQTTRRLPLVRTQGW